MDESSVRRNWRKRSVSSGNRRHFKYIVFIIFMLMLIMSIHFLLLKCASLSNRIDNIIVSRDDQALNHLTDIKQDDYFNGTNLAKYIHLDLKGAPPISEKFYLEFFNFIKKLDKGVQGFLIEYEDMLPLTGNLFDAINLRAFNKTQLDSIINSAYSNNFEIIPLIQTFGHLEWILKLEKYAVYRDDPDVPTVISPCHQDSYVILEDLIQQTLELHPKITKIHIGCDEVRLTNNNKKCEKTEKTVSARYIEHIQRLITMIRSRRPSMRILIWDDILRQDQMLKNKETLFKPLSKLIEPVSWNYRIKFDDEFLRSDAWEAYVEHFDYRWAASAFKGGLNRFSPVTNTTHHVLNHRRWIELMQTPGMQENYFAGIFLTGWSRFDHFMPLCDLLPTAYTSLIYSLEILNTNQYFVKNSDEPCEIILSKVRRNPSLCNELPGLSLSTKIVSFVNYLGQVRTRLNDIDSIVPAYNRDRDFIRTADLQTFLREINDLQSNIEKTKANLFDESSWFYDEYVANEWIELYVKPTEEHLAELNEKLLKGKSERFWRRRPLT